MRAKRVFISYNHNDSAAADRLRAALEADGRRVTIDRVAMRAGAGIQEFIEQSVREADVTLSIVSNRSLLSAWVAMESVLAFYSEKLGREKAFIACYLDDDFFQMTMHYSNVTASSWGRARAAMEGLSNTQALGEEVGET
ncbi:MAG: toll/interleukin-1 receptor domain-containing protein [Blastocatellia bacterium]